MSSSETNAGRKPVLGFTLIELLVVIAIIGLLSSVVLASLNAARERALTAAIKSQTLEFKKLYELEYSESGSYTNLNKAGWGTSVTCATRGYTGPNAPKAVELCDKLVGMIKPAASIYRFVSDVDPAYATRAENYSLMSILPDGTMFCVSSSGASITAPFTSAGYLMKGCYRNP